MPLILVSNIPIIYACSLQNARTNFFFSFLQLHVLGSSLPRVSGIFMLVNKEYLIYQS